MSLEATRPDGWLCRVALGLTLYLATAPRRAEVLRAWDAYKAMCPPDRLRLVRSTRTEFWEPLGQPLAPTTLDRYLTHQDARIDQGIGIWDGEDRNFWSFRMQGVVLDDGPPAASFLQIYFPEDVSPERIFELSRLLAAAIPFLSGHAGYTAIFKARRKRSAFNQIYAWAKRYLGIEVEDLNRTLPYVTGAIKGANWLTMVGRELGNDLMKSEVVMHLPQGLALSPERYGWVLRAGERPVFADRHRREFPAPYAAAERLLLPLKLTKHDEFAGRFADEEATMPWLRRLVEPERW